MTKPNGCGTGPGQHQPARAQSSIGAPHGETGLSGYVMTEAPRLAVVEAATMPTASEPAPTLINRQAYVLLRGSWDTAMTADRMEMAEVAKALCASLTAVRPDEALALIERLARHYPRQTRDEREAELYLEDWWEDVSQYPADILASACAQYRRSEARFMATPGQIRAIAEPIMSFRRRLAERAALIQAAQEQAA